MFHHSSPRRGSPQGCPAPGTAPANKWCAGLRSEPHRATKPPRCAGASASTGVGQPVATTEVFSSPIPPHGKMPLGGPDIRPRKPKPGGVRGPNSQLGGDPRSSLGCPSKRLRSRFPPFLPPPTQAGYKKPLKLDKYGFPIIGQAEMAFCGWLGVEAGLGGRRWK